MEIDSLTRAVMMVGDKVLSYKKGKCSCCCLRATVAIMSDSRASQPLVIGPFSTHFCSKVPAPLLLEPTFDLVPRPRALFSRSEASLSKHICFAQRADPDLSGPHDDPSLGPSEPHCTRRNNATMLTCFMYTARFDTQSI
jgi:hypothetical protein